MVVQDGLHTLDAQVEMGSRSCWDLLESGLKWKGIDRKWAY